MLDRLADFAFPTACYGCGRFGAPLCGTCSPRPSAGRRLIFGDLRVSAAAPYAGAFRKTILALKRGRRDAAETLAAFLAERLASRVSAGIVLVPVPTSARRRRERGFDQSVQLALGVGAATGYPVLEALALRTGDAQRGRSRIARLRARGRFRCPAGSLVRGVRIVLVDDVVTTGTTLRDCAETLQESGALVREAIVLAYA